jgi:NitT/TauT family transport system substrate-binding protein
MRVLAPLLLTVALLFTAGSTSAQTLPVLRIAGLPIANGAEAYYAADLGYFKDAGLDAQVTVLANGAAVTAALVGGSFDVGVSSIISASLAYEKGLQLKVVAPGALYESKAPSVACAVAKNSPIATAKDLDGKTFGVPDLGGLPKIAISEWMQKNGADPNSVKLIEVPFSAMVPALQSDRIDAAILVQPLLQRALDAGQARVLSNCFDAVAPQFGIAEFYSTAAYAAAHKQLLHTFSDVIVRAARWANAHPAEAAKIVERWTKAEPAPSDAPPHYYAERLERSDFQPQIDEAARWKVIKTPFPVTDLFARY